MAASASAPLVDLLKADTHGAAVETLASVELQALLEELNLTDDQYGDRSLRALLTALRGMLLRLPDREIAVEEHAAKYAGLPLKLLGTGPVRSLPFQAPTRVDVAGAFMLRTICKVRSGQLAGAATD